MRKTLFAVAVAVFVTNAAYAAAPRINHTPLSCVADDANAKIVAAIPGASSARVYFRAAGEQNEYWTEMRRNGDTFWSVLPLVCRRDALTYRIVASGDGEAATPEYNVPLRNDCAGFTLNADEAAAAQNLVVGVSRAANGNEKELRGFRCSGVTQRVSTDGEMGRFDDCTDCLVAAKAPLAGKIVAGAIAGVVTGVVVEEILDDEKKPDQLPVSQLNP